MRGHMIEFSYPLAFLLLIAPLIIYRFIPIYREAKTSVQVPFFERIKTVTGQKPTHAAVESKRRKLQWILVCISYAALVTAIAKPMWVGEPIEQKKSARELMVALDLSNSMTEKDFVNKDGENVDRLTIAKQVLTDFSSQRLNDRLGLILFADAAYVQAPFTEDIDTWQSLLNDVELGYAGFQTAFGDAIGLAIKVFEQEQSKQRVLILLTDGDDTSSKMPPIKAAKIAAQYGVKIYTIAIGDPSTEGRYKMDIDTLVTVAEVTGGQSFHAMDSDELETAYNVINDLEKQDFEIQTHRPRQTLHHIAFSISLITNLAAILLLMSIQVTRNARLSGSILTLRKTSDD